MPWPKALDLLAPLAPWFDAHRRDMPWRAEDLGRPHPDPYTVLVSEVMLQQTQVVAVIPYFARWMERFPTPAALAAASEDALYKAWEGLGYYRRARHLQAAASAIVEHGWPQDLKGLLALPGLGPYTAAAVASIAFQWPEPALDGNAFRVLARLLAVDGDPAASAKDLRSWLRPALRSAGPSRMTQAVMELGATVCLPRHPRCSACPLGPQCAAKAQSLQERIPPPKIRLPPKEASLWLLAVEAEGQWLLRPPSRAGLLAGLWSWPHMPLEPAGREGLIPQGIMIRAFPVWTQAYTHRRERVDPMHVRLPGRHQTPEGFVWIPAGELSTLPMGKRDLRLLHELKTGGKILRTAPAAVLSWFGI